MRKTALISLVLLATPVVAFAVSDTFLQAVGFALTGTDNAKVEVIDRKNCVFRLDDETFYLNNVQLDRMKIDKWTQNNSFGENTWITVELHGAETISESTGPEAFEGDSLYSEMKKTQANVYSSTGRRLKLLTSEGERVSRAWGYIYANGCVAKKSAF